MVRPTSLARFLSSFLTLVFSASILESISYYTLMTGICRAGYTAFPISTRNSAAAVAHLLKQTDASYIFVSGEEPLQKLARAALELFNDMDAVPPTMCPVPSFEELYPKDDDSSFEYLPDMDVRWDDPIIILHSSGMVQPETAGDLTRPPDLFTQVQLLFRSQ